MFLLLVLGACSRTAPPPPAEVAPPAVEIAPPAPPPPPPPPVSTPEKALRPVLPTALPTFIDDGDWTSLQDALEHSRRWFRGRPADQVYVYGPRRLRAKEMLLALDRFAAVLAKDPTPEELAAEVKASFDIFESVGDHTGEMLVTGYYEPMIDASPRRRQGYEVPIYGPPRDLIEVKLGEFSSRFEGERIAGKIDGKRLVPYASRQDLRLGTSIPAPVVAWAADRVELFFLEVQGSGTLRYPTGKEQRIGYATANGRPYRSIGRLLIDEGLVAKERMSMQALRAYLKEHPEEVPRVLDYNESVVFFRKLDGAPVGNLGLPVTAQRSVAVDQRLLPPGALGFLVSEIPAMDEQGLTVSLGPLRRFVLMQDTGGAIRGAHRADFFWGRGPEAAERAGVMKQPGRLYFLLPKKAPVVDPTPAAGGRPAPS